MTVLALLQISRRVARDGLTIALACALLLATVFTGRTYGWCLQTQQICSTECEVDGCDDTHEGEEGPAAHEPCCEARAVGDLPAGVHREGLTALRAAPPAILPEIPAPPVLRGFRVYSATRALPPGPVVRAAPIAAAAAERCAWLQVFRC